MKKMKRLIGYPVLLMSLAFVMYAFTSPEKKAVLDGKGISFFDGSLEEAKKEAKDNDKYLFVDVYATWCGPCKLLKRNTFSDEEVGAYFNENFVSKMVDGERGEGLALVKKHPIPGYPTMFIFDAEGNLKGKVVGYQTPDQLLTRVKEIIE
jgi:thioredoxin-related protein